jgi:hypothetical protein
MILEVYPIGKKVKLEKDIPGIIIAILIEPKNRIQYKVSWWSGRDRKSEWFDSFEVNPEDYRDCVKIGFINEKK